MVCDTVPYFCRGVGAHRVGVPCTRVSTNKETPLSDSLSVHTLLSVQCTNNMALARAPGSLYQYICSYEKAQATL